jgi:hypothetical protein
MPIKLAFNTMKYRKAFRFIILIFLLYPEDDGTDSFETWVDICQYIRCNITYNGRLYVNITFKIVKY